MKGIDPLMMAQQRQTRAQNRSLKINGKWKSSSFQLLDVIIERASQDGIGMLGKDIATTSK